MKKTRRRPAHSRSEERECPAVVTNHYKARLRSTHTLHVNITEQNGDAEMEVEH